jgi:alanyl-tRNA synthetase
MDGNQVRESYIKFFQDKDHLHMPSASLIPAGDPTLLFTSAGMVPFKPFFMGEETPPASRLTSHQKSFRTADIEEVGDHKHLTFFEMLGNFSIGDYFKTEAVSYAWELITNVFQLDPARIYVTVYLDDDEAYEIWQDKIGIPAERIYRYGDKDNWWGPAGDEGPTGPCSELHYDGGPDKGCGKLMEPDKLCSELRAERNDNYTPEISGCHPNCDCERFVELWNLVFMQFYQAVDKTRTRLPSPSVDTGMGLERITAVLQERNNVYETDLFSTILGRICDLSGIRYGENQDLDFAIRVVCEHTRASTFLIGDGVVPANEGRGYVLRRVIRRAIRYGRRLNLEQPFLTEVVRTVIEQFEDVYPELSESSDFIIRVIALEEERFAHTFEQGNSLLEDMIAFRKELVSIAKNESNTENAKRLISDNRLIGDLLQKELQDFTSVNDRAADSDSRLQRAVTLPGDWVFILSDTYGFPPELTSEISSEHGLVVDMASFAVEMEAQRERARSSQSFSGGMEMLTLYGDLHLNKTVFVGYEDLTSNTPVSAILIENGVADRALEGQELEVILEQTPFYAESGGQVGDRGTLTGPNSLIVVKDTYSPVAGLIVHKCIVKTGHVVVGDLVDCQVDLNHRMNAARNHSGTHLLHSSLRSVLGAHVRQAGSHVSADRLRFDFSHVSPLTPEEQYQVQSLANKKIRENLEVQIHETSYADAVREGALAFFGDRYGDVVRVVTMSNGNPFSVEVCGGTHVHATGQIGTLFVLGETNIGGGMRRIEALSGTASEELLMEKANMLDRLASKLQAPIDELEGRLASFLEDNEQLQKRMEHLERESLRVEAEGMLDRFVEVNGVKVISCRTNATGSDSMRDMGDYLKTKLDSAVVALGAIKDGNPLLLIMITNDLVNLGLNAGDIVRESAKIIIGGGGGSAEMAQAGGKDISKLNDALNGVPDLVRRGLES